MKKLALFLITTLLITTVYSESTLEIYSPNYFMDNNNVYSPIHYLKEEPLSFLFCEDPNVEIKNLTFYIEHDGTETSLPVYEWHAKKNCYYSNFDISSLYYSEFTLKIKYLYDGRIREIKREFSKEKESNLINFILGKESHDPLDVVYQLIVSNDIYGKESDYSKDLYEKLKNLRDNQDKCWPANDCDVEETAKILAILSMGGYKEGNRLIDDGVQYLSTKILSSNEDKLDYTLYLEVNDSAIENGSFTCDVTNDDETDSYTIDSDSTTINGEVSNEIKLNCEKQISKATLIISEGGDSQDIEKSWENINSIEYSIPSFKCIGDESCNYYSTIYTLIGVGDLIANSSELKSYTDSLIENKENFQKIDVDDEYLDTALYLYYNNNDKMMSFLKYSQNNDGSWGDSSRYSKIVKTAWSVLALQKNDAPKEYTEDGKYWIYFNEPISGWGSIEKNGLAYLAIKEKIKPILEIENIPNILTPDNTTKINIKNPTIYKILNLKADFGDLNNYLEFKEDLGDIEQNDNITLEVKVKDGFIGEASGYFTIKGIYKGKEIELLKAPVSIEATLPFKINKIIFDKENSLATILINNTIKDNKKFKCHFKSPLFDTEKNITKRTKEITTTVIGSFKPNIDLDISCTEGKDTINYKLNSNVEEIIPVFSVIPDNITIEEPIDFSINITNLKKNKIIVNTRVEDLIGVITPTEPTKTIAGEDTRDMFFTVNKDLLTSFNGSKGYIVLTSGNYTKKIPIQIKLSSEDNKSSKTLILVLIAVISIGLITLLIIRYRNLNSEEETADQSEFSEEELYVEFNE